MSTEEDTKSIANKIASSEAITNALITLEGEFGVGKTTFTRYLLRALGITDRIKSPTYAIVHPYISPFILSIWHFDLYRLSDVQEWEEMGFPDLISQQGLKIVEWPSKAGNLLPIPDLEVRLSQQEDESRIITLIPHTHVGQQLVATF